MSIASKVAIQINSKLMGAPWMIDLPVSGLMTVGFDICHCTKERSKSYGALIATMDLLKSTKYFSHVAQHVKGQDLSNEISVSFRLALKCYLKHHKCLPQRIVFYRDGVGEGQLTQVYETELQAILSELKNAYHGSGQTEPKMAYIIVTKRIAARFFANGANPPPGTVVDDIVTLPERYDFYLVSQSVRQGTVSPTNYNVIYDTLGLSADRIQHLTYKMTHLYYCLPICS